MADCSWIDAGPLISYDNRMDRIGELSAQLRGRRRRAGLSLSELARRVGTSAATLSRYENGWDRFEVYTLRKLATALGCRLTIRLDPLPGPREHASRADAVQRLSRLFWDHPLVEKDLRELIKHLD